MYFQLNHPMWLVGLNIDWDCLVPHCIMGSSDQWEFPLFFRPQWQSLCTALTAATACSYGCAKGLWKSLALCWKTGHRIFSKNIIFWLSQNMELMLISVSSPPTDPNLTAPACKNGIRNDHNTKISNLVNMWIFYELQCWLSKAPKVLPQWMCITKYEINFLRSAHHDHAPSE